MAATRSSAYAGIEKMLTDALRYLAVARDSTSVVEEGIALGKIIAMWGRLRIAVSDQRGAAARRAVAEGWQKQDYADACGVSRGMIQQLIHRANGTLPAKYRARDPEPEPVDVGS